jgi:ketosteroid isomerase-like protein
MSPDNPVAVVQRMLAAFEDRDLDRLVETVHPDSRWTYVGANLGQRRASTSAATVSGSSSRIFFET